MHAYYDTKQSIKIVNCEDFIEFYNPGNIGINQRRFYSWRAFKGQK